MKIKILFIAIAVLVFGGFLYQAGLKNGEQQYKQSIRMYYALKSAYHFGYVDAKSGRREDWDGSYD